MCFRSTDQSAINPAGLYMMEFVVFVRNGTGQGNESQSVDESESHVGPIASRDAPELKKDDRKNVGDS